MVVALAMGRSGIDQLLVGSQVVLSIVLPFVVFPLMWLTTSKKVMSVKKPESDLPVLAAGCSSSNIDLSPAPKFAIPGVGSPTEQDVEASPSFTTEMVDFSNGKVISGLGYLIWAVVVVANVYVLVTLAMGKGG